MIGRLINKWIQSKEKISFKAGFELTELPICTFYQNGKPLNFLLDTGSNDSIIDKNIINNVEHVMTDDTSKLYGLDGVKHDVEICNITLEHKGKKYFNEYLIQDMSGPFTEIKKGTGVTLHGLLGSKFFNTYKYVLDFDELIAYSKA